jgi:hypothetical protein
VNLMNENEMMEKIRNVENQTAEHEIFNKLRPPEEFGDAVELFYNENQQVFRAVVFDPETKTVFYEKTLPDAHAASSFITNVLDGKAEKQAHSNETEYINIYWDEWHLDD